MTIKDSTLARDATYIYNLKSGDLYFYNSYVISEVFEGITVVQEDLIEVISLVHKHFGFNKPYGLISHRLYNYSINLYDIIPIASEFGLLVANAVVGYSDLSFKNFELEMRLLKLEGEIFDNLDNAIHWTKQQIEKANLKANQF